MSGDGLGHLQTEAPREDLADLDRRSSRELVALLASDDATVPAAVEAAGDHIAALVDVCVEALRHGGRVVYVGAGTSGRLAVLDAAELAPTYGLEPGRFVAVIAGGETAITRSVEGAEDDTDAARRDLDALDLGTDDVVVGIAASGRTPYVLAAVEAARDAGARTAGVSNNPDTPLSARVDHPVEVLTGPEPVTGSTRMKSGTAQKLVLNTLSTAVMVRLGKVYGNLMVDVQTTNDKLRGRAQRLVVTATGVDGETAATALREADGEVKTAIVALLSGTDAAQARERLARADGRVRQALRSRDDRLGDAADDATDGDR